MRECPDRVSTFDTRSGHVVFFQLAGRGAPKRCRNCSARLEPCCVEDAEGGFSIDDLAALDQFEGLGQAHHDHVGELVRFARCFSVGDIRRHEEMDALIREPGSRHHRYERLHLLGGTAGLLPQFSRCTVRRRLARVEPSCRDLIEVAIRGVAVLPQQEDLGILSFWIRQKRNDGRRAGVAYDVYLGFAPVRIADPITVQLDDLPGVDALAADLCVRLRTVSPRIEVGGCDDRRSLLLPGAHAATTVPSGVTISTGSTWISDSGVTITP